MEQAVTVVIDSKVWIDWTVAYSTACVSSWNWWSLRTGCSLQRITSHIGNFSFILQIVNVPISEFLFSSDRQHLSYDGCLDVRGEIIRTVLCCIVYWKLCTVISTLRWTVLTVLWIGFCLTGPISLCVDSCVYVFFALYCLPAYVLYYCNPSYPIQRTVRTAHRSVLMTVHNFSTQYSTEQFW